jgi:integrase
MTCPSTASQEPPVKLATANVYLRHAKLFLGWYLSQVEKEEESIVEGSNASIFTIVPNKEKESADCLLEFILWLRTYRCISSSYEANFLRGLTKLLKFRFAAQSKADPDYGEKSFDDIPVIRELRKLHRDANKRQSLSPRSSEEDRKWLSWPEYLQVIQDLEKNLLQLIDNEEVERPSRENTTQPFTPSQREIAIMYQQYLILSFLACVPDRQRTIRELELKRSFVRDVQNGVWTIKHGPDDYKTGKTYGDRPPLVLSPELVPAIDDFLECWRPCLMPKSHHLFVQPRTGNPLTQDSVYQIVARSCYKYSGKKTNPHLLRDMIVTHVRESDASEKQLEALALYMGHSIQMQRTSYDRRTLTRKVAPAVELLQSVNKLSGDEH